jgi:hypothetical protein
VYYLIKGTTRGEQVLFRGERQVMLTLAREFRKQFPQATVWVTDRPVDVFGNCLLRRARFE